MLAATWGPPAFAVHPKEKEALDHKQGGRLQLAAQAYLDAFKATRNAVYLKKAGLVFMEQGWAGRDSAIETFRQYVKLARTKAEADEGEKLLKQAEALPSAQEPPAEAPAAPPPAPAAAPPPPPTPPAAPPDPAPPRAQPVDRVGSATWVAGLGFVQPGEPRAARRDEGVSADTKVPWIESLSLGAVFLHFGVGSMRLNPTNDGDTDDDTAFSVVEPELGIRMEFRNRARSWSPWFDALGAIGSAEREQTEPSSTDVFMSFTHVHGRLRVGVDYEAASAVGLGPFVGASWDSYKANLERRPGTGDPVTVTDDSAESEIGWLAGLHARFRTQHTPDDRPTLFVDPAVTLQKGHQLGIYAGLDAGVGFDPVYFVAWYQRRLAASGSFTFRPGGGGGGSTDAATLSQAYALSMPVEQRLGGGLEVVF